MNVKVIQGKPLLSELLFKLASLEAALGNVETAFQYMCEALDQRAAESHLA